MSRLSSLQTNLPARPWTSAALHALLGRSHPPCLVCGSAIFGVTHYGEFLCLGCHWDQVQDLNVCPMKIVLEIVNGVPLVREWGNALGTIERGREDDREFRALWEEFPVNREGI